jgi:hypothetical protein
LGAIPDGPEKQRIEQEILSAKRTSSTALRNIRAWLKRVRLMRTVVAPYAPILAAEGVDPVQMFQSFAANHYLLSRGTDAQKVEIAAALFKGYKIPLS